MSAESAALVPLLALFCGIALDGEGLAFTLRPSSLASMLQHQQRSDDALMRMVSELACSLPAGSDSAKVSRGVLCSHRTELPAAVTQAIEQRWLKVVTPLTGLANDAALRVAVEVRRVQAIGSAFSPQVKKLSGNQLLDGRRSFTAHFSGH